MNMNIVVWRLCVGGIRRWLLIICVGITVIILFQCLALPNWKLWSYSSSTEEGLGVIVMKNSTFSASFESSLARVFNVVDNEMNSSGLEDEIEDENEGEDINDEFDLEMEKEVDGESTSKAGYSMMGDGSSVKANDIEFQHGDIWRVENVQNKAGMQSLSSPKMSTNYSKSAGIDPSTKSAVNIAQSMEIQHKKAKLVQTVQVTLRKNNTRDNILMLKNLSKQSISVSQMKLLLLQSRLLPHSARPRWSSARDRELLSAKLSILNAPIVRDTPGLHPSVFCNVSMFKRSYELMERILKVYVYKEGEKPIFHQSNMRGIYASEGWFMKLMEGNKKLVVRDPRKAHLFYLPFSSKMLRVALHTQNFRSHKDLEEHLRKYVDLVARKYNFWNRTGGADHFLVGCHDWAARLTKRYMKNCIRALCNANVAKDFRIAKDTSLPVTYVRSVETPLKDLGGKPPSDRHILAFFAGGMHGYLRPILLQYWENKEPDMKIFGPLPRDLEGKRIYREYMKSSKYCICARGYEVHTPRVVEAILYECVPVIISDNYVPPFFEVLNWEAFSVFVQEKDIPNLRNILLSIPDKKYISLQRGVKMVQRHFFWHKKPVKYDLFHMILHSVWYSRVFQIKSR